jgi:hypothetical protein
MTDRESISRLLHLYAEGELSAEDRIRVQEHLQQCPYCANELALIQYLTIFLRTCQLVEPPSSLKEDIISIIEDLPSYQPKIGEKVTTLLLQPVLSLFSGRMRWAGVTVMILVIVASLGIRLWLSPSPLESSTEFMLFLPGVNSVTIAGQFNAWDKNANPLEDRDGDGIWIISLSLPRGRYEYKFVVNGSEWVLDPNALARVDDGFGGDNSLLIVDL